MYFARTMQQNVRLITKPVTQNGYMNIARPKPQNVQSAITWSFNHKIRKVKLEFIYTTMNTRTRQATNYISIINIIIALASRKRIDKWECTATFQLQKMNCPCCCFTMTSDRSYIALVLLCNCVLDQYPITNWQAFSITRFNRCSRSIRCSSMFRVLF